MSLQRLLTASTTGPEWGLSLSYDGFANKTGQTVTKGSAPAGGVAIDPQTNRMVGYSYDANGNQYNGDYDVENRLVTNQSGALMGYAPDNKRVWDRSGEEVERLFFYGAGGQRLAIYQMTYGSGTIELRKLQENFYFGGKMIRQDSPNLSETIATDRLGSVVGRNGTRYSYFPYGEEKGTPSTNDREKFGTYWRDSMTGWDYADQRYHMPGWGRFASPDPYKASAGVEDPGSWNRYTYVEGDPVNLYDSTGSGGDFWTYQSFTGSAPGNARRPLAVLEAGNIWTTLGIHATPRQIDMNGPTPTKICDTNDI